METARNMKNPISYDSSVGRKDGCRHLPISVMKQFLSLVAGFTFTSREYISPHLLMTAFEK